MASRYDQRPIVLTVACHPLKNLHPVTWAFRYPCPSGVLNGNTINSALLKPLLSQMGFGQFIRVVAIRDASGSRMDGGVTPASFLRFQV